jgi:hypothetical protein
MRWDWRTLAGAAAALLSELASWAVLARGEPPGRAALLSLAAHGAASVLAAVALPRLLPFRLRRSPGTARLIFSTVFFVPFSGIFIALGGALAAASPGTGREDPGPFRAVEIPALPRERSVTLESLNPDLFSTLRFSLDPARRLRAVYAVDRLSDLYAVPLLQLALRDPADEVRLLAYALLDGRERARRDRIAQRLAALERAHPSSRSTHHLRLAHEFFQLAALGVAQGEVAVHALESARRHAASAAALAPSGPSSHHLLGRVLLMQDRPREARAAFDAALARGFPPGMIETELAECDFRLRRAAARERM